MEPIHGMSLGMATTFGAKDFRMSKQRVSVDAILSTKAHETSPGSTRSPAARGSPGNGLESRGLTGAGSLRAASVHVRPGTVSSTVQ